MRKVSFAYALLTLLAIAVVSVMAVTVAPTQAATGCDLSAGTVWAPPKQRPLRVEAFSHGPSCDKAVVVVVVRGSDGAPLWVDSRTGSFVALFAGITSPAEMKKTLAVWIRQDHMFRSSANLPAWPPGADQPVAGEFPFYVEEGLDRDGYQAIRAARVPVFCYVQGMESMACVVLKDGGMQKVGVQSFPG